MAFGFGGIQLLEFDEQPGQILFGDPLAVIGYFQPEFRSAFGQQPHYNFSAPARKFERVGEQVVKNLLETVNAK
jgi:hypothetical protein